MSNTTNKQLSEDLMNNKKHRQKRIFTVFLVWTFILSILPLKAQDLPPTEELSLGSSVFVFRGSSKSTQKKYVARASSRNTRTKTQRAASTRRVRSQYNTLAKVVTRRQRVKPIPEAEVEKFLRASPKEAAVALTGAGQYYLEKGDFDKSVYYYRGAYDLDGANQDATLGLSDALASRGDDLLEKEKPDLAEKSYREALTFNDKNSSAYAGLGEVYDTLDKNSEAIASYEKALELDDDLTEIYTPLGILYYEQGEIAKADEFLSKAMTVNKDTAETQYFLGLIRARQERLTDALAAFEKSIKLDADSAETHYALGETLENSGRPKEAVAEFDEAVKLNPRYVEAWFALGVSHYKQANYTDAAAAYSQVVKLQNTNGEAHANLGDTYRLMGKEKFGNASSEYLLATYFIKNDAELYSKYGYVLGVQEKWGSAVAALKSANALSADAVDYTNLGWAYYNWAQQDIKAGRNDEGKAKIMLAKEALQKAVGLNDKFAPAYLNLGVALNDLGEYKDSVETLKRAVELRKTWVFAITELGRAYYALKDFNKAIEQFQRTIELDKNFSEGYFNLGKTQIDAGKTKDASETLKKLKALKNPNNNFYEKVLEAMLLGAKMKKN